MFYIPRIDGCIEPKTIVKILLFSRVHALMECGESGEDASGNADQILRNRGSILSYSKIIGQDFHDFL